MARFGANVQSVSNELDGLVYDFSPMPFENLHSFKHSRSFQICAGPSRGIAPYAECSYVPDGVLNGSGIMPTRRQVIAVRMSQLVGMGHKGQTSQFARLGTIMATSRT